MISSFLLCGIMNLIFCHLFYCFSFKVSDPLVFHFTANEQTYSGCYGVLWGRQPPVLPTPALQHVWLAWARISFTPEASWYYLSGIIFCVHACIHVCVCLCKSLLRCLAVLKYSSANKKTYKKKKNQRVRVGGMQRWWENQTTFSMCEGGRCRKCFDVKLW